MNESPPARGTVLPAFSGLALAYCAAAITNGILVVLKESVPAIKQIMYAATGHHWTTHAAALFIVLGACYFFFRSINLGKILGLGFGCHLRYMVVSTIIGLAMMTAYYVVFSL